MKTQKKTLAAAACIAALCIAINSSAQAGVLMQGFFRDAEAPGKAWWDNLSEKAHEMRSFGFTAIWIPPVLKGDVGGFSTGYDPFDDYDIGSKDQEGTIKTHWGTREQLQLSLCHSSNRTCTDLRCSIFIPAVVAKLARSIRGIHRSCVTPARR